MNDIQIVFSQFNPLAYPVSGVPVGSLRTAERIAEDTLLGLDVVSGILNDSMHSCYVRVIPRLDNSPTYMFLFGKFMIVNALSSGVAA